MSEPVIRRLWPEPSDLTDEQLTEAYLPADEPTLRLNMISSLDGAATLDGRAGPLGSPADQLILRRLRMLSDVVLVGAGTVRAEGYRGPLISPAERQWRLDQGRAEHPRLAIVSGSGDLPDEVFQQSPVPPLLLTTEQGRSHRTDAEVLILGQDRVDLALMPAKLHALGLNQILSEGGPHLVGELTAANLLDEVCLAVSPLLAGPGAVRITAGTPAAVRRLAPRQVLSDGAVLFTHYTRA